MQFMETSAKTNEGVTESFYALARWVVDGVVYVSIADIAFHRDIIPRIVAGVGSTEIATTDSVKVVQPVSQGRPGICCWRVIGCFQVPTFIHRPTDFSVILFIIRPFVIHIVIGLQAGRWWTLYPMNRVLDIMGWWSNFKCENKV
jgi:hypothetical protein